MESAENAEFSRLLKHLTFLFGFSEVNWSFNLKILIFCWHNASFEI